MDDQEWSRKAWGLMFDVFRSGDKEPLRELLGRRLAQREAAAIDVELPEREAEKERTEAEPHRL